jgi:hypothetical protein
MNDVLSRMNRTSIPKIDECNEQFDQRSSRSAQAARAKVTKGLRDVILRSLHRKAIIIRRE